MDHATQIALAHEVYAHLDAGTTCLADAVATNPVDVYTCQHRLARERERLFRREPQLVGLSCRLPEPGTYLAEDDAGVPILLVRDRDGAVRAFLNVCRHRGARVAAGSGKVERNFVCPYHGWAYGADGRLVGIPDGASFAGVDRTVRGLVEIPVCERDGLIWVRPSPGDAIDVDAQLHGLAPELAGYRFGRYHLYASRRLRYRINWKAVIDTFLEPYHFAVLHPNTVAPIFFPNLCLFHPFGPHLRETFPRRSIVEMRARPESEWDLVYHSAIVYLLFPNAAFVMQADHAEVWRVYPVGDRVDESIIVLDFYIPEPAETESARRHWERNLELVLRTVEEEDFPTGEGIQSGHAAGANREVVYGRNEPALQHWQRTVARAATEDGASAG